MRNIKGHALKTTRRFKSFIRPISIPEDFKHENVPYFCQWESKDLAGKILAKEISTDDDPKWKASGAKDKKEYNAWSWSACGMACTKMILAYRTGQVLPIVELGKKCAKYGGYTMPLESSVGLLYKPYIKFVSEEFGWKAKIVESMSMNEVMQELGQGNFIIVSVSPLIRNPKSQPKTKGGHLVLMTGYDKSKGEFYIHNPSGTSKSSQEYAAVSFDDFKKFFSGRGIVIQNSL
jgi:hypothetical protein